MIYVLALDVFMASLLVVTILACLKLNVRIKILQDGKSELRRLIDEFNEASVRAEESIAHLHSATKKTVETLQLKIDRANYLAEDMHFMIDKGSKLADKMEAGFSSTRKGGTASVAPSPAKPSVQISESAPSQPRLHTGDGRANAERILAELGGISSTRTAPTRGAEVLARKTPAVRNEDASAKAGAAIESVLEKISSKRGKEVDAKKTPVITARPRSQAERELLQALRANR